MKIIIIKKKIIIILLRQIKKKKKVCVLINLVKSKIKIKKYNKIKTKYKLLNIYEKKNN
jgi:hypothetical protein